MYLSRLVLDIRNRAARRDLADCQEMHRTLLSAFPEASAGGGARQAFGVLYRVEPTTTGRGAVVLVQSAREPQWAGLPAGYLMAGPDGAPCAAVRDVSAFIASVSVGQRFVFRLRANPTRKIDTKSGADGARRNGRRVDLRRPEDQIGWLERRATAAGFVVERVRIDGDGAERDVPDVVSVPARTVGRRLAPQDGTGAEGKRTITFGSVLFQGCLRVTDEGAFREALRSGIGPGKAYGHGLLSIAPPA